MNGILAYCLSRDTTICITDGDTEALTVLRENVDLNLHQTKSDASSTICCQQLIWDRLNASQFLETHGHKTFDVLLASDIVYAKCIVEPLWATVQVLLSKTAGSVFVMAYAKRDYVPVTIEYVLESSTQAGFEYELAKEDAENEIFVYLFRWKDDSTRQKDIS